MLPNLHLEDVGLAYDAKQVFSGIHLTFPAGKIIALLGPSGVGKSSFIRMLANLTVPNETISGRIYASNHLPVAPQIAYMAQQDLLLPWLTALDNANLSLKLGGFSNETIKRKKALSLELLEQTGLGDAIHLYPHQLSGGMRQRVALVRTLIQEKPFVLMDEPFSALDTITRYHLQNLALRLLKNKTVIFITHDPAEALRIADEIYLMQGNPAQIRLISEPKTKTPRAADHPESIQLHTHLFQQLTGEHDVR